MKRTFAVAALLLPSALLAQPTATMSGVCVSMMFAPVSGATRGVIWTTYSASHGFPLNKRTSTSRIHSLEFRPRASQPDVYEADYIVASGGTVLEFGSITLNVPTVDSDTNGVPDMLQFERGLDVAISGTTHADYSRGERLLRDTFTGVLHRDAAQFEGNYRFDLFADGESVTERFRILSYDGTVTYDRDPRNSTATMTLTAHREDAQPRVTVVQYRVLTADKVLIPAQWVVVDGARERRHRVVLNRVGNRYVFTPNNRDGDSRTPWKDYVRWIEQIVDTSDTDANGIPDFSDPGMTQ